MNPLAIAVQFMIPLCLWREARGSSQEARRGVLHVIVNRAKKPSGPYRGCKNILEVILCARQFSAFNAGDPNASKLPNSKDPIEWKAWEECCEVAENPGSDPTFGADHYHSIDPHSPNFPEWAKDREMMAKIGPFCFYKLYS